MSIKSKRTIFVGPTDGAGHKPLHIEGVVQFGITPGTVMQEVISGLDPNMISATQFGEPLIIADIDRVKNKSVDADWINDESMVAILPRSGEFINILVATGQVLIRGDALSRDGNSLLRKAVTDSSEEIVGYADENITTTEPRTLVRVRIA